jgi:hypothetical protein
MPSKGDLEEAYKRVAACAGKEAAQLREVIEECFSEAGSDLEDVRPGGWEPACPHVDRCRTAAGRHSPPSSQAPDAL